MKTNLFFKACLSFIILLLAKAAFAGKDTAFKQPVSIKYQMPAALQSGMLKKTVVDYNDVVYVLSDKELYRVNENSVVKDLRYTPLAQLMPLDITVRESTGNLYYLYNDKWLTNAHADLPYAKLPEKQYSLIVPINLKCGL